MKILVLLSASLFGFGLICQDVTNAEKPATTEKVLYTPAEEPVTTIALDTVTIIYEAPVGVAEVGL